eukprot:4879123-Pleurochrysis_carterae.AAC.3
MVALHESCAVAWRVALLNSSTNRIVAGTKARNGTLYGSSFRGACRSGGCAENPLIQEVYARARLLWSAKEKSRRDLEYGRAHRGCLLS